MRHLVFVLFVMASVFASAQTVEVSGTVKDLQGKVVADVIVKVMAGKQMLAFVTTSAKGTYTLTFDAKKAKEGAVLTFTHIAYEEDKAPLNPPEVGGLPSGEVSKSKVTSNTPPTSGGGGGGLRVDAVLVPKIIALKEVKVRANPLMLKGDTLSYNLSSFLKKGDVTLEDGLKNLPGITISESGAISYMGQGISHFYIEGLNMLGGRYNLATKNIPAQYATQVEILKHHKARRIDEDEESDNVAINVKLSKKAKFKPFGQPVLGVGTRSPSLTLPEREGTPSGEGQSLAPLGRDGEGLDVLGAVGLTGMMFTDNFQLLGSAKWSNHGNFGSYDMIDHSGNNSVSSLATDKLGRWGGGSSPVGEYLYQTNGYATLNGIEKIDSVRQIRANADYTYEHSTYSFSTQTLYFANGENISVSEHTQPLTTIHRPSLNIRYEHNAPSRYVSEVLTVKAQFEENECPVNENTQERTATIFNAHNSLSSAVRIGKHKLSLTSSVGFNRAPSVVLNMNGISQSGQSTTLATSHGTTLGLRLTKKWRVSLPVSLDATYNMVEANQRVAGWRLVPMASPSTSWKSASRKAHASLGMRLRWLNLSYLSNSDDKRTTMSELFVEPNLTFSYTFSGTSEMSVASDVSHSAGDILDLLTVPVHTSYRSTSAASGVIGKSQSWTTRISYKKQVPFSYFTFSANASWTQGKRNVLSSQTVSGATVETASIFRDSHSQSAQGSVSLSKNILPIYAKLTLNANMGWSSSEWMSQGRFVTTYASNYSVSGTADITPVPWIEMNVGGDYSKQFSRSTGLRRSSDGIGARGSIAFSPMPQLELRGNLRYVHSLVAESQYKDASMLSASAQYKAKRAVWKLTLNNLLNTRAYTFTTFRDTDRFTHTIDLVGRTVMLSCKLQAP